MTDADKRVQKPKPETVQCIDLIGVLNYMNQIRPGLKERVFRDLADHGFIINDTMFRFFFDIEDCSDDPNPELTADYRAIVQEFEIEEGSMIFSVSW